MPDLKPKPRPTPPPLSLLPRTQADDLPPAQIEAELNQAKRTPPQLRLIPKPNEQTGTKKSSNILNFKDYQANRVNNLVQQRFSDEADETNDDFDQGAPEADSGKPETINDIIAGEQAEALQKNKDQARNENRIASASEASPNLGLIQVQSAPMPTNGGNQQESEQSENDNQDKTPDPTEQENTINNTKNQARNSLSQNVKNTAGAAKNIAKEVGKDMAKKAVKTAIKRGIWWVISAITSAIVSFLTVTAWIWIPCLIILFIVAMVYNYSQRHPGWAGWDILTGTLMGNPEKIIINALNDTEPPTATAKPANSNSTAGSGSSGNSNAAAETNQTGD